MSNEETQNDKITAEEIVSENEAQDRSVPEAPSDPAKEEEVSENAETAQAKEAEAPEKSEADSKKAEEKNVNTHAPKKAKPAKKPTGMSKLFKLVYYPVLSLVVLIMLVFSIIDGVCGYSPKAQDGDYYKAVDKHLQTLASSSRSGLSSTGASSSADYIASALSNNDEVFRFVREDKQGNEDDGETVHTVTGWRASGKASPLVTLMTSTLTGDIQTKAGETEYLVGTQITNVVAAIPSKHTVSGEKSDAVIVTIRYDSRTDTVGATDNAAFAATAVESLIRLVKNGAELESDLIVVFTEDYGAAFGAKAFFTAFDGLDDVVSRAKAGLSLDAFGNAGTLAITDATAAGLDYLNTFTRASGTAFNSSIVHNVMPEGLTTDAVSAFADANIQAVQVAVVGGLDAANSYLDSYDNVSKSILKQQAKLFNGFVNVFAGNGKTFKENNGGEKVFFSYFDWGTVSYTAIASYVLGAIIIALIAGVIVATAVKKTFSLSNMLKAVVLELLVVAGAVAAMFAVYFLVTLMLTGFGAIPIHAITQVRHFNAGIIIAAMLVAVASAFGFTTLFKKLIKVTSSDSVRGTALLFALAGAVMSFAAPAYSYLTVIPALLMTVTLLVTVCFNGAFKERFGFGFDRLFIFAVPAALSLPVVMAPIAMLTQLLPLYMLPLTMSLFVGLIGVGVPYLDRTTKIFDKLAKKLPERTLRIERVVTEKVEDRAKKGKFTERTVKRIDKEKVPVNYKNYFGISVLTAVAVVIALLSGGIGVSYGKTVTDVQTYKNAVYNDALVYEWDNGTQKIVVDDLIAYKYFRYAVNDLKWNRELNRYELSVGYSSSDIIPNAPEIGRTGESGSYVYNVNTFDGPRSNVIVTIPNASLITKITVTNVRDIEYIYEFNNAETIVLNLPYGFGNFSMKFEGDEPSAVEYEEQRTVTAATPDNALANVDEWNRLLQYYRDSNMYENIRGGIVLKYSASF